MACNCFGSSSPTTAARNFAPNASLQTYKVDNVELKAGTNGVQVRASMNIDDKDPTRVVEWGSMIDGVAEGSDWVHLGDGYLPVRIDGKQVLFAVNKGTYLATKPAEHMTQLGVVYRTAPTMDNRSTSNVVHWGETVQAIDMGNGFLQVSEGSYLPFKLPEGPAFILQEPTQEANAVSPGEAQGPAVTVQEPTQAANVVSPGVAQGPNGSLASIPADSVTGTYIPQEDKEDSVTLCVLGDGLQATFALDGTSCPVTLVGNVLSIFLDGKDVKGKFVSGSISWDDGDVWQRQEDIVGQRQQDIVGDYIDQNDPAFSATIANQGSTVIVTLHPGDDQSIITVDGSSLVMVFGEEKLTGEFKNGTITWSDGDVWSRQN